MIIFWLVIRVVAKWSNSVKTGLFQILPVIAVEYL